ncbi:hypothetical protein ACUUL3_12030 [Thiovibrio sp. JS02]
MVQKGDLFKRISGFGRHADPALTSLVSVLIFAPLNGHSPAAALSARPAGFTKKQEACCGHQ